MAIRKLLSRNVGHPIDEQRKAGFDFLEIICDTRLECDVFVEKARAKFWHSWLIGESGGQEGPKTFGGLLYKPSGIQQEWDDHPDRPHPGIPSQEDGR